MGRQPACAQLLGVFQRLWWPRGNAGGAWPAVPASWHKPCK